MGSLLVSVLSTCALASLVWKVFREYFVESPLDRIPGPPASSLLAGNIPEFYDKTGKFYHKFLQDYLLAFKERLLFLYDPKALHHIFVKDQHIYEEAPAFIAINKLFFGEGLLSTLAPIFYEVTGRLRKAFMNQVKNGPKEIDVLHWMTRTALELIGQSGMGYSFDSLKEDAGSADIHPYSRSVKRFGGLLSGTGTFVVTSYILPFAARYNYPRLKRWIVDHIPSQWVQDLKNIVDTIQETAVDICKMKQLVTLEGHDGKKDIISVLVKANASAAEEDRLSDEEVYGQVASLTFAAMDTSSSALSRIICVLGEHQDVQDRLREELLETKKANHGEELDHDQLTSLPYLDAVCRETLRLYVSSPHFIDPEAYLLSSSRKDMILPLSKPLKTTTGEVISEVFVPDGTTLFASVYGTNADAEIWGEDSHEWKPERWLKSLPETVAAAHIPSVYSHLMTFLGGSRACIGFKFAQLEIKIILSVLLTSFKFEQGSKKILWTMPGITAPVVDGDDITHPSLPMIITALST
ncbi:putative cytochrome P450 6a13 [Leucoagaricus sp. SymC.cos]|nr:putative cytochrome P450 6a13 [Leucoagaricus sp. SymC.cos]